MKEKVIIKQNPEKPEPVEVLAESIKTISDGMKKIRAGRLNDRALTVLLKDATGVPLYEIKRILDGIEGLEALYLRGKKAAR